MKYTQNNPYQNINGNGPRECERRWEIIEKYITPNPKYISIDVGSAEGFFVKKIVEKTKGNLVSIEGSQYVYEYQKKYCKDYIETESVKLYNWELKEDNINFFCQNNYQYCLLLAVLHWMQAPDLILKKLSEKSEYIFVELPDLDDENCYNKTYLQYIKNNYTDYQTGINPIKNYLQSITGKRVIGEHRVPAHTTKERTIFVLSGQIESKFVNIDLIYNIIHGNNSSYDECYLEQNFKVVPISKGPAVKYLMGDTNEYLNQSHLFGPREATFSYLLNQFDSQNFNFEIKAIKYNDKYVICDGMHRAAILVSKGYKQLNLKIVDYSIDPSAKFEQYITNDSFQM